MSKRDAAYYRKRLKSEHPLIYADLMAGRIPSTRQAAAQAGLIHLPTRLSAMKKDWKKATTAERRRFLEWLKSGSAPGVGPRRKAAPLLDSDGYLSRAVADRVLLQRAKLGLGKNATYVDMGLKAFDYRINGVLDRRRKPPPEILEAFRKWLGRYGA